MFIFSSCKLYHKPTRFETVMNHNQDPVMNHVANYTTNQLGLKPMIIAGNSIKGLFVANYTTNQLGLKPQNHALKPQIYLCCKLYHKPTRFETPYTQYHLALKYQVANYTTNQLGLKHRYNYSNPHFDFLLQIIPQTNSV